MDAVALTLNPPDQQDAFTEWMRGPDARFIGAKRLADGTYAGLLPLIFTYAICVGVTREQAYQKRYCYEDTPTCLHEYAQLTKFSDEPTGWVARRPQV